MSRTQKSTLNSLVGLFANLISGILGFFLRGVFIRLLGLEYAGINSLFADLLKLLNLVDLGVSNAILVRLYRSCAQKNDEETELYLATYRRICYTIAAIVTFAGLACTPFLKYLIKKQPSFPEPLWSLFAFVLAQSFVSHALSYQSTLFTAKQERFIDTLTAYSCLFLQHGLQLVSLFLFKNIYYYLVVPIFTTILRYGIDGYISHQRYGLRCHASRELTQNEKIELVKDVGSLSVYKLARTLDATIDTMLITRFVSVALTGIYGSINMLFTALDELLASFNDGIIASVGILFASGQRARTNEVFFEAFHFAFFVYGLCAVTLAPVASQFSLYWITHTLPSNCLFLIILNFYMHGLAANVSTFRNSMGLFRKGWKQPAATAALNLIFSYFFIQHFGLLGTLLGTFLARLLSQTWFDPFIICHFGFYCSPIKYYVRYLIYLLIVLLGMSINGLISLFLPDEGTLPNIIFNGTIHLILAVLILGLSGFLFPEHKKILVRIKTLGYNILRKQHI